MSKKQSTMHDSRQHDFMKRSSNAFISPPTANNLSDNKIGAPEAFKIVHGTYKFSKYSTFSLLLPEHDADRVHTALSTSTNQHHEWTVAEDTIDADDVQSIPPCLGFIVPTGTLPETFHKDGTKKQSEEEILNILLSRGSIPLKKYVIGVISEHVPIETGGTEWFDKGVLCIEFNGTGNDTKARAEVVQYLEEIADLDPPYCEPSDAIYSYLSGVEIWEESKFIAKKDSVKIERFITFSEKNFDEILSDVLFDLDHNVRLNQDPVYFLRSF